MSFAEHLVLTMNLFKGTPVVDADGEERITWSYVATLPCVVQFTRQYAYVKLGVQETVTHKIYCEYLDVLVADPKAWWRADVEEYPGVVRTYLIVEPKDPMFRQDHLELAARRLDEAKIGVILATGVPSGEAIGAHAV